MTLTIDPALRAITVEEVVPHAADIVWKVLTTPELIQRWLMKNDFKPGLGQHFTFKDRPRGDWNGIVADVWDVGGELQWQKATGDIDRAETGLLSDKIDLGGWHALATMHIRF